MKPPAPAELLARAAQFEDLSRWERAELGRALRRLGWTYGEIRGVIPVPKGTLSNWCREIRLNDEQVAAIKERTYGSRLGVPVDTQWRRRMEIEQIEEKARSEVAILIHDPLWVAGVLLYWGEGAKTDRILGIVNSDERLLNLFIAWTRAHLDREAEFVLALNLHADNDESAARAHWKRALDVETPEFTKTFIKPDGTGHRKNHLPWGVCRVRLRRSTDAWIRTMAWIDSIIDHLRDHAVEPTATLPPGR